MSGNNNGFILVLDALLAVILFISLMQAIETNYFADRESFNAIQLERLSNDALTLMDGKSAWKSLSSSLIDENLVLILPENISKKLVIRTYDYNAENAFFQDANYFSIDNGLNAKQNAFSGTHYYLNFDNNNTRYYEIKYWLWWKKQ